MRREIPPRRDGEALDPGSGRRCAGRRRCDTATAQTIAVANPTELHFDRSRSIRLDDEKRGGER